MWQATLDAAARAGWRARRARPAGLRGLAARRRAAGHLGGPRRGADAVPRGPRASARSCSAVHDWGGLIGLRWACDAPGRVRGLVVSSSGFFPDGKWHGLAQAMRTPGEGEQLADGMTREGFDAMLALGLADGRGGARRLLEGVRDGASGARRTWRSTGRGTSRSSSPTRGASARSACPALLVWGADDAFAPLAGGRRLREEIPGARLVVLEGEGHFVFDDAPALTGGLVAGFLDEVAGQATASGGSSGG